MGFVSLGLRSSGLLGGGDWEGERVVEVETPGSIALSVESCDWSRVCVGVVGAGDGETTWAWLVGASEEVLVVVVIVVTVVVQFGSVLALLVMETGGL